MNLYPILSINSRMNTADAVFLLILVPIPKAFGTGLRGELWIKRSKGCSSISETKSRVTSMRAKTERRSQLSIIPSHWSQRKVCTETEGV